MQNICTNNYCKFILKFFRHVVVLIQTGRCVRLTTLPPSCADCFENLQPQPPEPSGTQACTGIALPLLLNVKD